MSDTQRPKSAGDKLSAEEINKDLPIVMTAGEAINGATLPVAIYIKDADGEVYACDADDQDALEFIGFAVSNGTDGNPITVQTKGIVSGFSGLDAGKKYYVQDDKTIGTSVGTYQVLVGIAISSTELLIFRRDFTITGIADDTLRNSNDAEHSEPSGITTYTKVKEITLNEDLGGCRIKFDLKRVGDSGTAYGKIYKNGVAIGTEQSNVTTSYVTKSEDLSGFMKGDKIQIYVRNPESASGASVRYFRLYYTRKVTKFDIETLATGLALTTVVDTTNTLE